MAALPLVGVTAAIQGMSAFTSNANTFSATLSNMMRGVNAFTKAVSVATGADASAKNAAKIQAANDRVARITAQNAQNVIRANNNVTKSTAVSAAQDVRAQQMKVNAATRATQAQKVAAQARSQGAATVTRANNQEAAAAQRLTIAQNLLARAYTPAREASAQRAAVSLASAQQRVATVTTSTAAKIAATQNASVQAVTRYAAATNSANATQVAGAARVAGAVARAAAVQNTATASTAAATSAAASTITGAFGGIAMGAVAMAAAVVVALLVITVGLAKFIYDVVSASNAYQHALTSMAAISGESGASVEKLSHAQLEMTRHSTLSAMAMTNMTTEMVKAGLGIDTVIDKALAVGNAMTVASNGELQATQAATLLQVAYAGFGRVMVENAKAQGIVIEQSSILPRAADSITAAVQRSTLTFSGFSDAFRQGGGMAARMGYTLEEFTAIVGTMGLTIQSGTEIGTGLRQMFVNLQNPSDDALKVMKEYGISLYDTTGKIRPARDVIKSLTDNFSDSAVAAGKLTQAQRDQALGNLFTGRTAKTVSALLNAGIDEYDKMYDAVTKNGTANEAANKILATTESIMTKLGNTWNAVKLSFGEGIEPFVNKMAKNLETLVDKFFMSNDTAKSLGETIGGVVFNAFSALGEIIETVIGIVGGLFSVFGALIELVIAVGMAFNQVCLLVGALVNNLAGVVLNAFNNILGTGETLSQGVGTMGANIAQTISTLAGSFWTMATGVASALIEGVAGAWSSVVVSVSNGINILGQAFNNWLDGIGGIPGSFASALGQLAGICARAFSGVLSNINAFLDKVAATPLIGELVTGARAAVGGFLDGFSSAVGSVGVALTKFKNVAVAAVQAIKLPDFRNYAAETLAAFKAGQAGIKKAGIGGVPDGDSEPGSYPPGGGKEPKDKAGEKAAKDYAEALKKAQEILRDFFRDMDNAWRDHAEKIGDAFQRAEKEIAEAVAESEQDIAKSIQDASEETLKLDTDKYWEKDTKTRTDALDKQIEAEVKAREYAAATTEIIYKRGLEDLQLIEEQKQAAIERTFDKAQATAARVRDEMRAAQDREYGYEQDRRGKALDKQQDQEQQALDKRQDAEKAALDARQKVVSDALEREQDVREAALKRRLQAEEDILKASQDARMTALEKQIKGETTAREYAAELSEINTSDAEARAKAEAEYQRELAIGVKQSIAAARRAEKITGIDADTGEKRSALAASTSGDAAKLAQEESDQARIAALQATFDAENLARQATADAATLALKTENEAATAAMKALFATQDLALKLAHEQAVDQLHEQHELARDALDRKIQDDALARAKDRAKEDRDFAEKQEAEKRKFMAEEAAKQLAATRLQEDADRTRKQALDDEAERLAKEDEAKKLALTETLEQEQYDRRITQIGEERDKKIAATNEALRLQQEKIAAQLARELVELDEQLAEKIKTIKEQYIDKLETLVEEGGERMRPIVDNIGTQMEDAFAGARDQVKELITVLEDALKKAEAAANAIRNMPAPKAASGASSGGSGGLSAPLRPGGKPGETQSEVDNFNKGISGKQYGGTVQGPFGSSQLIEAHGGEFFAGIGGYGSAVAAVRSAESMLQRGMGGSTQTSNIYNYNVNASYGQTQEAGSVRMDLAALVAMTRR